VIKLPGVIKCVPSQLIADNLLTVRIFSVSFSKTKGLF